MLEQNTVTISISSQLETTGTGFGIVEGTGESCFIPPRVMLAAHGTVGDIFQATVTENPLENRRDHTPYMVTGLKRIEDPSHVAVRAFIERTLSNNGVWTAGELFHEYTGGASLKEHTELLHAFITQTDDFFRAGKCARFTMERAHNRGRSKVWYTCSPDLADVAEWEPE